MRKEEERGGSASTITTGPPEDRQDSDIEWEDDNNITLR